MSKFDALFKEYNCQVSDEAVSTEVAKIIASNYAENNETEVYKKCLNLIDLTSLNSTDTEGQIAALVEKVNNFSEVFPQLPNVAAICVYPALVPVVKSCLMEDVAIVSVVGGFPAAQTFVEVKVAETAMSVFEGATEIDTVLPLGKFFEGKFDEIREELSEIKASGREAHFKVILETGLLGGASEIKKAAFVAMASGAQFIKTSTGKMPVSATLEATYVMCQAIKEWFDNTGIKVGFKPAGGIVTTEDAVKHYTIVKSVLGEDWLNNEFFRFGASRLANSLLTSIEGRELHYF